MVKGGSKGSETMIERAMDRRNPICHQGVERRVQLNDGSVKKLIQDTDDLGELK